MIDAEEAEVLARAAAENGEARAREETGAAALERARREAAEQARTGTEEMERRRVEPLIAGAATIKPEAVEEPVGAMAPVTKVGPRTVEEVARGIEVALAHTERTTGRQDISHLESAVVARQVIDVYAQATGKNIQHATHTEPETKDIIYAEK